MAFTLVSNSFKEGETLAMDYILSADYGFGCGDGNKSPASYIRPVRAQDRQTRLSAVTWHDRMDYGEWPDFGQCLAARLAARVRGAKALPTWLVGCWAVLASCRDCRWYFALCEARVSGAKAVQSIAQIF
jgi:hypothetical protein